MPVVILCGGSGLRMKWNFENIPKPLIPLRDKPILEYIIDQYYKFGINEVFLLVGLNEELFIEFANQFPNKHIKIHVIQTGADTPTGARIKRAHAYLKNHTYFYLTYGDGIGDIDLKEELQFHQKHGKLATLTAVRPQLPFGLLKIDSENSIFSFIEKPILEDRINCGFFILNTQIFRHLDENSDFEIDILPQLSNLGELKAYLHNGFWKNIDTYKDYVLIQQNDYLSNL